MHIKKGNSRIKSVQSLVLNADILQTCSESVANPTALEKDLPKPFCLKILLLTTVSVVFSFRHCSGKLYVSTGNLHIKSVCWKYVCSAIYCPGSPRCHFLLAGDSCKFSVLRNMAVVTGFSHMPAICIHT